MSTYGELIQALGTIKNVKEKRLAIKSLAHMCSNRAFQVRIVQRGGWRGAILPLVVSLDEDCRKYAALAIANLSACTAAHKQLMEEQVLKQLVPVLQSEETPEVLVYVLTSIGNFACSTMMWPDMRQLEVIPKIVDTAKHAVTEEILMHALFCIQNLTQDPVQRAWMLEIDLYELVWGYMKHPNYKIMQYALSILRGLSVETIAQEKLAYMGLVPMLIGIYMETSEEALKSVALDIFLHLSFVPSNAKLLLQPNIVACIQSAAESVDLKCMQIGVAIIANLCESVDFHDQIIESSLFKVLTDNVDNDITVIQQHVIRAMMQLSRSPRFHHVIMATGVASNVCPIAMTEKLSSAMRINALQMLGALCATHPTTPVESDVMDLAFLICNPKEDISIRRASMLVLANASSDKINKDNLLKTYLIDELVKVLSDSYDVILTDYLTQFFHNMSKMDPAAGPIVARSGFANHMFTFERLESLSITSAIYLCDTCRHLSEDRDVRAELMAGQLFANILDTWLKYVKDARVAPHLALMCSAFTYHSDAHQEFVLQGGVKLVIDIYERSQVEHVRLCCVLSMLYLAENEEARRSIFRERGLQMLVTACENETHIDLITNALKALIPYASADDYRPQMGMEGAMDTFASFMFSDQLQLQQLGVYLLQQLLEYKANRRIFLGLASERKCDEEYLEALVSFLPRMMDSRKINKMTRSTKPQSERSSPARGQMSLTPHDPFIVRSVILSLELLSREHESGPEQLFHKYQVPKLLFDLFTSEQIDKSSAEAVLLTFANLLHGQQELQDILLRKLDVLPMLLSCKELSFKRETNASCLSAILAVSRVKDFRPKVMGQLENLMINVSGNMNETERDEVFYATAALQCAILSELARASVDFHERMAKAGCVEALLVFITVGRSGGDNAQPSDVYVELMMSSVFGLTALVSSPIAGEQCMQNLVFPAARFQLFMSLLRKPEQEEIGAAFHVGTPGLRALQRVMEPAIVAEELQVDCLDATSFIARCEVPPAHFLYRNVLRALCLLLAHPDIGRRVLEALSVQNVLPTCLLALQGTTDVYVSVFGYLLAAKFSSEPSLLHGFVCNVPIMSELLSRCRRHIQGDGEAGGRSPGVSRSRTGGTGPWAEANVERNKYLLAMTALTNLGENAKEKYKTRPDDVDIVHKTQSISMILKGDDEQLGADDTEFLRTLAATSFRDVDAEALQNPTMLGAVNGFVTLLRLVLVNNCMIMRIVLEKGVKGGEVQVERIDAAVQRQTKVSTKNPELVPVDLRSEFRNLVALRRKTDSLLHAVAACVEAKVATKLASTVVECLGGIAYFSPLSIAKPFDMFVLIKRCPEWLMPSLSCLFANMLADKARAKEGEDEDDFDPMSAEDSECLFPLLSKSFLETREHMIGALSNLSIQKDKFYFVQRSGIFDMYEPLKTRGYFLENFAWMLQMCRLLANLFSYIRSHKDELLHLVTPKLVGFLSGVLHITADLVSNGELNAKAAAQRPAYDNYSATFGEDDIPPLGLKIWWSLPPRLSELLPDTPAAALGVDFQPGDELIEVNGVDVSFMEKEDILPMFEDRPLDLYFRRPLHTHQATGPEWAASAAQGEVETVEKLECYGDRPQYIECFNLVLLSIHNLATQGENLPRLLAEPQLLKNLLEILPHKALSPTLRRLLFSTVTCLARDKDVAGIVFGAMKEYFESCDKADPSLHKYVLLSSNLFYTAMKRDEVQPNKHLVAFVGQICALESATTANMALVEILHGMSQAPEEQVRDFSSRDTMVSALKFMENDSQWDCQARAFESIFFLTKRACQPSVWLSTDLLPRMVKAAAHLERMGAMGEAAPELQKRADAAWEMTLRTAQVCLSYPELVDQFQQPDLDHAMMESFSNPAKPIVLAKLAAEFMAGLFQTPYIGPSWHSWRSAGFFEKLLGWCKRQRRILAGEEEEVHYQVGSEVSLGDCMDSIFHMLIFALEAEPSFVGTLSAADVTQCIALQILSHSKDYRRYFALKRPSDEADLALENTHAAFRIIAQLMTALLASEKGLTAMTGMNLEAPLVTLLEMPRSDHHNSALVVLCALSGRKEISEALLNNESFLKLLVQWQETLRQGESTMPVLEHEYYTSLVDRMCCHPELSRQVGQKLFVLVSRLAVRATTANCRLLGARVAAQCGLEAPEILDRLPSEGPTCLHYVLAATSCLRVQTDDVDGSTKPRRRSIAADIAAMAKDHPQEARMASHYARAVLCEAVSVSRNVCQYIYAELDCTALLRAATVAYGDLLANAAAAEHLDLVASEALNHLVGMMHILLCVVFRQGSPGEPYMDPEEKAARSNVSSTVNALDALFGCLQLHRDPGEGNPGADTGVFVSSRLSADIRVQFWLSALLREVCAKPLRCSFLGVVRTRIFLKALEASIRLALKRLEYEVHGPAPKDLFAKRQVKGMRDSPLVPYLEELSLALVFEHLIVALRHTLVQAMYVQGTDADDPSDPWRWKAQESAELHRTALSWLPEVVKRFGSVASIKTEAVRYICAISSFYEAPGATAQNARGPVVQELLGNFSVVKPEVLELLTLELEATQESCTLCLACMAIANLTEHLCLQRKQAALQASLPELPLEDICRLARAVVRALREVPKMSEGPQLPGVEVAVVCMTHSIRALSCFLALNQVKLTVEIMVNTTLEAVQKVFELYFRDDRTIRSEDDYARALKQFVVFMRNWAVAGCAADQAYEKRAARDLYTIPQSEVQKEERELAALAVATDVPAIVNFLVGVAAKLWEGGTRNFPNKEASCNELFADVLLTLRTLLKRSSDRGSISWVDLQQRNFERLLEAVKEHRFRQTGQFEDEELMGAVYLLTFQGFPYISTVFPKYMMQIAYGPREEHTPLQDVAAVCCAIQSTRLGKGKASQAGVKGIEASSVIKDYADFVHGIAKLKAPRMQVWHYRLLAGECQNESVLAEVAADSRAMQFIVDRLCDEILGRYSVAIVHNMSVQKSAALVSSGKYIVAMCESYRGFGRDDLGKDASESRLLRRLLVASMRNCLLGTDDLERGISNADIAAIIGLVPDLERPDYQLYMAMLLALCRRCPKRALAAFAAQPQVMELLARCILEKATACMPTNFHQQENSAGSDLYVMQVEEDVAQQLEEEEARRLAEEQEQALVAATPTQLETTRRLDTHTAHERGLGKRANLWQTRNRERLEKATGAPTSPTAGTVVVAKKTAKGEMLDRPVNQRSSSKRRGNEHEYIYFAAQEILTSVTFVQAAGRDTSPEHQALLQAVDLAFKKHTVSDWLQTLKEQVILFEKRRIILTDLYVKCSAKLVWHCWMNPVLKAHIDTPGNLEAVAAVAPLFLGWSNPGVRRLFSEVALVARLHRHPIVTDYLVAHTAAFPELSSSLLANALAEPSRPVRMVEARSYLSAFVELLKARSLTRMGLRRLLLGLEHAVLADHPEGLCNNLVERSELLMELVEALRAYSESPVVKHCIAVMLAQTMGRHYQPINELDEFVLQVLDLSGPLLESEFAIFMPVLHGLLAKGGRRVAVPLLQRQLHMRVARLLEEAIDILEHPDLATEPAERKVPSTDQHQTVQWNLALLTLLAGCNEGEMLDEGSGEILRDHHPLFEAFVCVDLLPVLVRVLRASPGAYETLAACFLISSVAKSSCIVPYMPDIVRLAEQAILPRLRAGTGKMSRRRESVEIPGHWQPIRLPVGERMLLGINRSFIHLMASGGYQPPNRPALLNSKAVFEFVAGLQCDVDLFSDPAGPLHAKLHNLAHLCACRDNHAKLLELGVLRALREAQLQMAEAAEMLEDFAEEPHDLRLHWLHCIVSLLRHEPTGVRMVSDPSSVDLILSALNYAEEISLERRPMKRRRGLDLVYNCQAGLAAALARLSARVREDFVQVYPHFTLFLLGLVCSGPLVNLRIAACDHLQELLAKGCQPILPGAVLIKTPCADSFKRTICGTHDGLVTACTQVMIAFCRTCGYSTHIHLASRNAEAAVAVIADSGLGGQPRITSLAELVLAFSMRTQEVLDVLVDVPDLTPFLRLARSNSASRRQVVQTWLEMFGSSMYEIEETIRVFGGSTMNGFLHLAANSTLEPEKSQDLRRCLFAVVHGRVDNWRRTPFGITQFMGEELIKAMIPMCELQPDLVAGVVAMFHSFITHDEKVVLNRVWKGGHFGWLCKRMTHKSRAQAELVEGRRTRGPVLPAAAAWEDHGDLLAVQGMSQRLAWILYDMNSLDAAVKVVDKGWIIKNWQTHVSYYCHHTWPQRDRKELEEAMDSVLILAMKFAERLTFESVREKQLDLIKQGILRLCSTVLLPRPEDQRAMLSAVGTQDPTANRGDNYPPEASVLQKQKMIAGSITVRLMQLEETYEFYKEPHAADLTVGMLAQLHHWREAIFYQQGSVSVLTTVGLLERSAALYSALVSGLTIDWHLDQLGLRNLEVFCSFLLDVWCRHPNSVLKHHALRLVSLFCQLHVLFVSVMTHDAKAAMLSEAVHRILGIWDVRELRQVTRLMVAALSHALGIPVMPERVSTVVAKCLTQPDAGSMREVLKQGGALRANQAANRHLLLPRYMNALIEWCEHPGDLYGRVWCLWLVLTLLVYGEPGRKAAAPTQTTTGQAEAGVLVFGKEVEEKHILRRARLEAEQQSVALHDGKEAPLVSIIMTGDKKDRGLNCRSDWLCGSPRLGAVLARMASKCLASGWKPAELASCASAGRCLVEHPHFLCNAAEILNGGILVRFLMEDDRTLALASLTLISLIASYRLPLKAQNVASSFLTSFYNLQESVIEGFSRCGEGPYDQAARWLAQVPEETPLPEEYRCLVTFMVGQAVLPPLAVPPSLDVGEGPAEGPDGPPAVADCDPPPVGLMDKLGQDVLQEDQHLKDAQVEGVGPLFSSMLCHLLYALAVIVPFFPKAAAESPSVRGAAFSQLFKIQQIVSLKLQPKDLFDPLDQDQCKLFLYIRAMACIKLALRVITGSWFAPDIGVRFVVSEQGGRDFMQYCTRHIIQVYNGKTAVTRVLGTPWERVMLSQGPTETIAELLLMVCSSDANLVELERLGGDRALHGLAQFAEKFTIRQQAAMLLSKLAVMTKT